MNENAKAKSAGTVEFTIAQQIDFKKYERVRAGGRFNMFDPRARAATGLDRDRYTFVMKNYCELKAVVESDD